MDNDEILMALFFLAATCVCAACALELTMPYCLRLPHTIDDMTAVLNDNDESVYEPCVTPPTPIDWQAENTSVA